MYTNRQKQPHRYQRNNQYIFNIFDRSEEYKDNQTQYINRMEDIKIPKMILNFQSKDKQDVERQKQRQKKSEVGTGNVIKAEKEL